MENLEDLFNSLKSGQTETHKVHNQGPGPGPGSGQAPGTIRPDKTRPGQAIKGSDKNLKPGYTRKTFILKMDYYIKLKLLAWSKRQNIYIVAEKMFKDFLNNPENRAILDNVKNQT